MRINHNIPALNAHRLLNKNTNLTSKALERLSSGKKINKAADDAAGMAISEKMKAQVRGLKKASQNTLDGISLIQTAEGAMNEVHSMLQRMRELAVQAANGTMTNEDRKSIQDEINQLTSEVNRIANGTEFNTRNILRGNTGPNTNTSVHRMSTGQSASFVAAFGDLTPSEISSGEWSSMTLSIYINGEEKEVRFNKLAQLAGDSSNPPTQQIMEDALLETINNALAGTAKAIFTTTTPRQIEIKTNSIGGSSEIRFVGEGAVLNLFTDGGTPPVAGRDLAGNQILNSTYKGVAENDIGLAKGSFYFDKLPEVSSTLIIGNETIEFYNSAIAPYAGSNRGIDLKEFDKNTNSTLSSDDIEGMVAAIANMNFEEVELIAGNDTNNVAGLFGLSPTSTDADYVFNHVGESANRLYIGAKSNLQGFAGQLIYLEGTPKEFITNLQIGPNQGQGFRLEIGDIRAQQLKISSDRPDGNPGVKGAKFFQDEATITDGLSPNKVEYALDVMSEETATAAITVYNNAILRVAELRGALGAIQNRLEYTAANLDNTTENLTAALSRIEDADMALEMSEFTKLNILTQAGTAMLAQANQRPQSILQLLGN